MFLGSDICSLPLSLRSKGANGSPFLLAQGVTLFLVVPYILPHFVNVSFNRTAQIVQIVLFPAGALTDSPYASVKPPGKGIIVVPVSRVDVRMK